VAAIGFSPNSAIATKKGPSGASPCRIPPEPKCIDGGSSACSQMRKIGSQ
jgi:hypothetical protein